jgi:signal transduction histidine kinase
MARLIDVLQAGDEDDRHRRGRLRVLLDSADASGLEVRVTPLPADLPLPADVEEGAYRLVQEGLTNTLKHAPGAAVHVRLAVDGDELEIEVRDEGAPTASPLAATGSGLGLTGMRERMEQLGGSLEAGPMEADGWRLRARVPLAAADDAPREVGAYPQRGARSSPPGVTTCGGCGG